MRLNVFLQRAGLGSRRDAERMVAEGRVSVNGAKAGPTTPVEEGDAVHLDGKPVGHKPQALPRLFMLNKPLGVLVTARDSHGRQTIYELPALQDPKLPRLIYVGRLDVNSEGLLLLSSDGGLADALMSPANALARVYRLRMKGRLKPQDLVRLARGVTIEGFHYRGAVFEEEPGGAGGLNTWYRATITEGKNREVRRLVEHFGGQVNRLIRVSYGPVELGNLQPGELREVAPRAVMGLVEKLSAAGKSAGARS